MKTIFFIILSFVAAYSSQAQVSEQIKTKNDELYFSAQSDILNGETLQAIAKLKQIVSKDSNDCDAQNLLCLCYAQLGDFNQASYHIKQIIRIGCYEDKNLLFLVGVLKKAKKEDLSLELLQAYSKKHGYKRAVFDLESEIYLKRNDVLNYIQARKRYNVEAADYLSGKIEEFYMMIQVTNCKKAYKFLEKQSRKEPNNVTMLGVLLDKYINEKDFEKSKKTLFKIMHFENLSKERKARYINSFRKANFDEAQKAEVIKQTLSMLEQ